MRFLARRARKRSSYYQRVEILGYLVTVIVAYFIGSIPTGYLVARAKGIDIRTVGSGNIGATNAFRVLGKGPGAFVLLADALKGYIACRYAVFPLQGPAMESHHICAGLAAILGHNYTCWLRFKGGKGIATSAGVMVALVPMALLIALAGFVVVFSITRYVSLGSITAAVLLPIGALLTHSSPRMIVVTSLVGALAIYKHRGNIQRLLNGTENRIGKSNKTKVT